MIYGGERAKLYTHKQHVNGLGDRQVEKAKCGLVHHVPLREYVHAYGEYCVKVQ